MTLRILALAVVRCLFAGSVYLSAQPQSEPNAPRSHANNEPTYLKLRNIKVGSEQVAVSKFTLKRDAGLFTFNSGTFYFLEPVNGKITGAVFVGDGTFSLKPPLKVEQRNLAILTRGQPFEEQFSTVVFRFTDGTDAEIRKAKSDAPATAGGDPGGALNDVQQQLKKKLKYNLAARLLEDVLSSAPGGKFIAFVKGKKYGDKIVYDVDPHGALEVAPEEVSLMLWDDNRGGVWAGFHLEQEYAAHTATSAELNDTVRITHQTIDTAIAKSAQLTASAKTTFVASKAGTR